MLGASLPNDGFSQQVIADFNDAIPKNLAYVNVFSAFSHDWDNLYWQSKNVVAQGATPMISWMPIDLSRRDANLLPEIAIGMWDDYLDLWGRKLLAWVNMYPEADRPRLAIRFAHEFNGNWYPYSNTPVAYTAAWQHIHDKFDVIGVNDHVDWIWSASKTNVDDYDNFCVYYPGDEYVDWTSLDGYNWGSNYATNGWSTFGEIFNNGYLKLVNDFPDKPIMIAETGSAEPTDLPNTYYGMYGDDSDAFESKSVWIGDMLSHLEAEYPAVRALSMFNINKELGWSISTEFNTGIDAWVNGTQSTHYTSDLIVASAPAEPDGLTGEIVNAQIVLADLAYASAESYSAPLVNSESLVEAAVTVSLESGITSEAVPELAAATATVETVVLTKKEKREERQKPLTAKSQRTSNDGANSNVEVSAERSFNKQSNKRVDANEQRRLARSKKPKKTNDTKGREFANTLRNLNPKERKQFRKQKFSVIEY